MAKKASLPESALSLIDYPSRYPLKVFGHKNVDFELSMLALLKARCPKDEVIEVRGRASQGGNYIALTLTFTAQSQKQLEQIYQDLFDCDKVVMSL